MAKLTLQDPVSMTNQTSFMNLIAENNAAIETALENTFSLDGTTPNAIESTIDMNSRRILNLPAPVSDTEPLRLGDIESGSIDVINNLTVFGANLVSAANAAAGRTVMGLSSAAITTIGTSGAVLPLLDGNNTYSGTANFSNTTDSTSPTTGAIKTAGGLGVAKDAFFGDDVNIADTLTVTGATTLTSGATYGAGSASVAPITLTSGTNLTTASPGAIEYDGKVIYGTAVSTSRQVINAEQVMVLSGNFALTDTSSAQKAFNATANGALTLAGATAYEFEGQYLISNTGTNAHTWTVLFGGTGTITSAVMVVSGRSGTTSAGTLTADASAFTTDIVTGLVSTASSTSSTEFVILKLRGILRVNAAGTFIPQVKLSATTGGTITMLANSFIRFWPIGINTVTNVGNWS